MLPRLHLPATALLAAALLALLPQGVAAQGPDTLRLSVADAVTRALRSSDESRLADAQVEIADAQVLAARATGLPQLRLNSTYSQVLKNARAEIVGAVFGQNYVYNSNLQFSQPLLAGGRVLAASQAASRFERAALATREESQALLAVDIQRAYLNVVFTTKLLDIQRNNLALADDRLAQAEQLERAGRSSRYEVLRARVERANIEPQLRQAEAERGFAELELRRLLDLPLDVPLALTTTLDEEMVRQLAADAVASDRAPGRRPAVEAAEFTAEARRAAIRVARADLLPSVNFTASFGYLALPSANGFPTVLGETSNSFCPPGSPTTRLCQNNGWFPDRNIGFQFSVPVFDGLRAKGQIDLAQALAKAADVQARQVRELATVDIALALGELERARAVASARATNLQEAEEAYELASLRYARGIGTQLEVSDAQLALLTARSTDARALFDLYLAVAELARVRAEPIPLPDGNVVTIRTRR